MEEQRNKKAYGHPKKKKKIILFKMIFVPTQISLLIYSRKYSPIYN